jgi:hypothetical protein
MATKFLLFLLTFLALPSTAFAETLTAVCGPFKGNTVGVSGSMEKHKPLSYADSMDGLFSFTWEVGSKKAMIIGPGQNPTREEGVVVLDVPEQVSAVVIYSVSVFLYSIFPERKTMLITKHTHLRGGLEVDAARGFIMQGNCVINLK